MKGGRERGLGILLPLIGAYYRGLGGGGVFPILHSEFYMRPRCLEYQTKCDLITTFAPPPPPRGVALVFRVSKA